MNKVVLVGRLTAKPELRYTASNTAYTRFSVAVIEILQMLMVKEMLIL